MSAVSAYKRTMSLVRSVAAVASVAVLVGAPPPADACSCEPPPPPCEAYWDAEAVFTGKVTHLQSGQHGVEHATFDVSEKFKGPFAARTIVVEGGGMCGRTFELGGEYFVYASGRNGQYYAPLCTRGGKLADAKADLQYARNLPKRKHAILEGTVVLHDDARTPRAGVKVIAKGTPHAARSDARGRFQLAVPPGTYTLDVDDPALRVLWGRLPTVEVKHVAACAHEELGVEYNGRIQGTITDDAGKPVAGLAVSAHPTAGTKHPWRLDGRTDAAGRYEIAGVPPGTFVVGVSHPDEGGPQPGAPYPTTFHPDVAVEARAKRIQVPRAGLVRGIDLRLGKRLAVYKVTGVLKRKGAPLAATYVKFDTELAPKLGRGTGAQTDAAGRFAFEDVAGAKVKLEVCRPDAGPDNYQTACRTVAFTLDKDRVVELEYPAP